MVYEVRQIPNGVNKNGDFVYASLSDKVRGVITANRDPTTFRGRCFAGADFLRSRNDLLWRNRIIQTSTGIFSWYILGHNFDYTGSLTYLGGVMIACLATATYDTMRGVSYAPRNPLDNLERKIEV